jgi:uncharacterized protein (DUF4415 family)
MSVKSTKPNESVRYLNLDELPPAPPLRAEVKVMSDAEIIERARSDRDAQELPEAFWDHAEVIEPEGTEQITLRLPKRVLGHFRATGKGYQSRISAVLSSYVDASVKRRAG